MAGVRLRLSHHFNVSFFSFAQCVVVAELMSGFPSKGIIPYVAGGWYVVEEVSSGSSYVRTVDQNP